MKLVAVLHQHFYLAPQKVGNMFLSDRSFQMHLIVQLKISWKKKREGEEDERLLSKPSTARHVKFDKFAGTH